MKSLSQLQLEINEITALWASEAALESIESNPPLTTHQAAKVIAALINLGSFARDVWSIVDCKPPIRTDYPVDIAKLRVVCNKSGAKHSQSTDIVIALNTLANLLESGNSELYAEQVKLCRDAANRLKTNITTIIQYGLRVMLAKKYIQELGGEEKVLEFEKEWQNEIQNKNSK